MITGRLSHYEILEQLGAGGMGEVYRVHDTRLQREVAIKVIPPAFLQDPERLARFEREARVLAALNHPNIGSIYGLEEDAGRRFLVLELVPGQDLEKRLASGPMPLHEAIGVAGQVADALEAAHRQGIIHRDLKPGNIAVTADGTVKVLDFGLAKALDEGPRSDRAPLSHSPTILGAATGGNVILGTAAYMSPEQARGNPVDARTDVWAFGCVLYECLTGRRAFSGESVSDTLAAVLRDRIDLDRLPPGTPPALRRLLRRTLERDASRRLRSLADAKLDLEDALEELSRGSSAASEILTPARGGGRRWLRFALWAAGTAALVLVAFAVAGRRQPPPPVRVVRFTVAPDSLESGTQGLPAISADGSRIAYVAAGRLWIRPLDRLEVRAVPQSAGAVIPFWSPDGSQVGFYARGRLWKASADGGDPVSLCDTPEPLGTASAAAWGEDGRIIFGSGDGAIYGVSSAGGRPVAVLEPDPTRDDDFHEPRLLPGDRGIVYIPHRVNGSIDEIEILSGGARKVVWADPGGGRIATPIFSSSGHLLFHRDQPNPGIWALPFSLDRLEGTGEPFLVASWGDAASVSGDGTLVYTSGSLGEHRLVWLDRTGAVVKRIGGPARHIDDPAQSPSGQRLLTTVEEAQGMTVTVQDLRRGSQARLASSEGVMNPFWVTETQVAHVQSDSMIIVLHDLVTGGAPEVLFHAPEGNVFQRSTCGPSVDPSGRRLYFCLANKETRGDLWMLPLDRSEPARPVLATPARETGGLVSPDGGFLAFVSDVSGRDEIYVSRLLPDGNLSGERWQVSSEGADIPRWSESGKHLYYSVENTLMEVEVDSEGILSLGLPTVLLPGTEVGVEFQHGYDVEGEGSRILAVQVGHSVGTAKQITVVQNWFEEFRPTPESR